MTNNDLLYVAAAVQPHFKTIKNDLDYASPKTGFFASNKNDADFAKRSNWKIEKLTQARLERERQIRAEHARETATQGVETIGLSKAAKVGHRNKRDSISHKARLLQRSTSRNGEQLSSESYFNHNGLYELTEKQKETNKTRIRLMHREWAGQYRILQTTQGALGKNELDVNSGDRFSEKLTKRAVTKIFESGAYVATCHGGFTTFVTLTFTKKQRNALFGSMVESDDVPAHTPISIERNMSKVIVSDIAGAYCPIDTTADDPHKTIPLIEIGGEWQIDVHNKNGEIAGDYCPIWSKPEKEFTITKDAETSIGNEVSRFVNGAKKMFVRGWKGIDKNEQPFEVAPNDDDFFYMWVAECPPNDEGEPNPHVHLLMKWEVEPDYFQAWAKRLEGIWGNGLAHIERIKQPKAASSYLLKAVGYAAKGENGDQGLIKGNRYGIAKCARAPAWECIASFEAGNMAGIIKECAYKLEQWKKPLLRYQRKLNKERDSLVKAKRLAKDGHIKSDITKITNKLNRIENAICRNTEQMRSRGVHASTKNQFCLSFDGENANEKAWDFLLWSAGARGWSMIPVDGETDYTHNINFESVYYSAVEHYQSSHHRFLDRQCYWRSVLSDNVTHKQSISDEVEQYITEKAVCDYYDYRTLERNNHAIN
ncbi:hypothetical protein WAX87_01715 [Photobacterium damselae subsp. damselae]|uniref:hypothetical protein n=1 Tax=Photobacterium damselae TaxID=38293 RepID=UPI000D057EDD|nr:hypothetical protein [Photobacterium damselae]PSB83005.1 hypothetical protein C5F62_08655 [Photobacterium damselae subsp. damselae]TGZ34031.1 hypothetical protein EQ875_02597 [Photobacterium damselae subsp. damselae]